MHAILEEIFPRIGIIVFCIVVEKALKQMFKNVDFFQALTRDPRFLRP